MLNDRSSLLAHLATRRSGRPRTMVAPGPSAEELRRIVALAARTPDHGKLTPWRFVEIADRMAFAKLLTSAFRTARPDARDGQVEAAIAIAHYAPTLVALLFEPRESAKVPAWEQRMSVGAAAMNFLHAAHGHGYVAGWITGWAAEDPAVAAALSGAPGAGVAGFLFVGTPGEPLEERPRPALDDVFTRWPG